MIAGQRRRRGERATLRDVAQRAGVSPMTVSRVLNRDGHVRQQTRETVERAAMDLSYVPSSAAKALAHAREAFRIALLFDTPNATVLGDMVGSVSELELPDVKLGFMRVPADADPLATLRALKQQGAGGVVLTPPLCDDARLRIVLASAGIRLVGIGCSDPDPAFSAIGIDDRSAAAELTTHLLSLGHRRIGLIVGHPRHRSSARRRAGFEMALSASGLKADPTLQWQGDYSFGTALGIAEQALALAPPLTAIFASNDDMAAAVVSVARGRGIAVPETLSVCGFDDSEIARMMCPQLTTVAQPLGEMAVWGVRQLAQEMAAVGRGDPPPVRKVTLDHRIVCRGTDAPPPGGQHIIMERAAT